MMWLPIADTCTWCDTIPACAGHMGHGTQALSSNNSGSTSRSQSWRTGVRLDLMATGVTQVYTRYIAGHAIGSREVIKVRRLGTSVQKKITTVVQNTPSVLVEKAGLTHPHPSLNRDPLVRSTVVYLADNLQKHRVARCDAGSSLEDPPLFRWDIRNFTYPIETTY